MAIAPTEVVVKPSFQLYVPPNSEPAVMAAMREYEAASNALIGETETKAITDRLNKVAETHQAYGAALLAQDRSRRQVVDER